jgi:hypothetical protein
VMRDLDVGGGAAEAGEVSTSLNMTKGICRVYEKRPLGSHENSLRIMGADTHMPHPTQADPESASTR